MLYVLNTEEEVRMDENIIKGLENEGIYLEGKLCDNELIGLERVIRLINDKKLQELDVCEEMMRVIAKDCIKLLEQSDILGEGDEINKDKLEEYLEKEDARRYKNMEKGANKNRVCFLDKYSKNDYDKYINLQNENDLETIMDQRAIEEFGANIISYDPDVSLVIIYIYCKLLQKKDGFKKVLIKHNKSYRYKIHFFDNNDDKNMIYCGDTMTSWWTSLKAFLEFPKEIAHEKFFSDMDISSEMKERKEFREIDSIEVKKFMKAVYTIGNFCPVPEGFNGARSNFGIYDYWDLTLMKIREWYLSVDSKDSKKSLYERDNLIQEDLLHNAGNPLKCLRWLESFGQGQIGWHNFVDTLYMQDYVDNDYNVISFWTEDGKKHGWKEGETLEFPKEPDEIEKAFETMTAMINASTTRIAEALVKQK